MLLSLFFHAGFGQDSITILKSDFARSVSPECFDALLKLLHWSWTTFHVALDDVVEMKGAGLKAALLDVARFGYICGASLRLIRAFINQVYT